MLVTVAVYNVLESKKTYVVSISKSQRDTAMITTKREQ